MLWDFLTRVEWLSATNVLAYYGADLFTTPALVEFANMY